MHVLSEHRSGIYPGDEARRRAAALVFRDHHQVDGSVVLRDARRSQEIGLGPIKAFLAG